MKRSYNGWPASRNVKDINVDPNWMAAGRRFPGGMKIGPVGVVLRYVIEQFNLRVEPLSEYQAGDEWGHNYRNSRNSNSLSCHASGTAPDLNATQHPNGRHGTFTPAQVAEIRKILKEVDYVVRWGGDFPGTKDEMHFEIHGNEADVARVAKKLTNSSGPVIPTPIPIEEDGMPKPDLRGQAWMLCRSFLGRDPKHVPDLDVHHMRLAVLYEEDPLHYIEHRCAELAESHESEVFDHKLEIELAKADK